MSYTKPQITPPSPLKVAIQNGDLQQRIILAAFGSPLGKPARNTRHLTWRVGEGDRVRWPSCFDRLHHHQQLLRHLQGGWQASVGRRPDPTSEPASAEFGGGGPVVAYSLFLPAFPQARHVTYTIFSKHVDIVPVLQIRDVYPGSWFFTHPASRILDFGSQIQKPQQKRGAKIFFCWHTFFYSHKFHKIENYFIFEMLKKKIWPSFQRIIEFFTQKFVTKL